VASKKPSRKPSIKPTWQKDLVKDRIEILFKQAGESFKKHPERSRRYIEMALKLSTRYNVRLSPEMKRKFCKSCKSLLIPDLSSRTRTSPSQKALIITCQECGHITRHPYRREKARRNK
jgi:ribonuclease P protein subunit RPR2